MPGLQFGSGAYARATAPLIAAPFTWLIAGLYDSLTGSQNTAAILCRASTGGDSFQLRFDSADSGAFRITTQQGGSGSSAITSNAVAASTPFVAIVRVTSSTSREAILNGDLANKATDTASKVPASIDRLSFGRKDDSGATNDFEGSLWYSGLWNVALSDEEILALAAGAPVPRIRPAALQCWWVFDNASTIVDRLGRAPATVSSGSLTGENGRVYGLRRVYAIKTRARYLPLAAGAYALTGHDITLRAARKLPLGTGAFVLTGNAIALLKELSTAIGLPVLLDTKQATSATLVSNTLHTTAGALLIVLATSRRVNALPPGLIGITDNVAGGPLAWEACVDDVIQGVSPSLRGAIFRAIAPGGDMTVTLTSSLSARQILMVVQIDRARIGILNVGRGISADGDPAAMLAQAPKTDSIVLGFGAFTGVAEVPSPLASEFPEFVGGGVLTVEAAYTRLNPPQAVAWGTDNAQSVGLAIEVEARDYKLEPGSFTMTGQDMRLRYDRRLPLEPGVFALTGQDVATRKGYSMTLAPASFGVTGHDVAMRRSYALQLRRGAFAFAGQEMVLRYGRRLSLGVGNFAMTGQAAALRAARRLALEPVAFSLAAENVSLRIDRNMALARGSFVLSGDEVTLRLNRNMPLAAGSFVLTGKALGLRFGHKLPLATGAFALTGRALTPRAARRLPLAAGSFALAGQALGLRRGLRLPLTAGSFVLTGQAVALSHGYRLPLAAAAYSLAGQAVALRATRRLLLAAGSFTLTGRDVALRAARRLALATGSFTLTGETVRLAADRRLNLGPPTLLAALGAESGDFTGFALITGNCAVLATQVASGALAYRMINDTGGANINRARFDVGSRTKFRISLRAWFTTVPNAFDVFLISGTTTSIFNFGVTTGRVLQFQLTNVTQATGTTPVPAGRWVSIVIRMESGGATKVWLDGALEINVPTTATFAAITGFNLAGMGGDTFFDDVVVAADPDDDRIDGWSVSSPFVPPGAGSFRATGQAVALRRGAKLPLGPGAFTLAGQAVALRRTATLGLAAGSFSLTGAAVALRPARRLPLLPGDFSLAGQDIALRAARKLLLAAGGFSLTGSVVVLRRAAVLPLAAGSFVLTGRPIALARVYTMRLDRGVFVLAGQDIDLVSGELLVLRPRRHLRGSLILTVILHGSVTPLQYPED